MAAGPANMALVHCWETDLFSEWAIINRFYKTQTNIKSATRSDAWSLWTSYNVRCEPLVMRCSSYWLPLNSIIKVKGVWVKHSTVILTLHKWDYVFVHRAKWRFGRRSAAFMAKPAAGTSERDRLQCDYDDPVWSGGMKFLPRPPFGSSAKREKKIKNAEAASAHTHAADHTHNRSRLVWIRAYLHLLF